MHPEKAARKPDEEAALRESHCNTSSPMYGFGPGHADIKIPMSTELYRVQNFCESALIDP